MQTTVDIPAELLARANAAAAACGRTLSELVNDALRDSLAAPRRSRRRIPLQTFKGTGVRPGVDLTDNSALLDLMEEGIDVDKRR